MPYWYVDAGALFMLLQLAALDEGLAAGVYGVLRDQVPAVNAVLGVRPSRTRPARDTARLAALPAAARARRARPP